VLHALGEMRDSHKILVMKPHDKGTHGRHKCKLVNIKINLRKVGFVGGTWTELSQDGRPL